MKFVLGLVCLTAVLVTVSCKFCSTDKDCEKDGKAAGLCCMAETVPALERKGMCVRLAKLGQKCHLEASKIELYGNKYIRYCPCAEGLECKPKEDIKDPIIKRESHKCQKKA